MYNQTNDLRAAKLIRFLATILLLALTISVQASKSERLPYALETVITTVSSSGYSIIDYSSEDSGPLVINLQDYHGNYATQLRYNAFYKSLLQHNDQLQIAFIGLEGSSGFIDTSIPASLPDKAIQGILANQFLKKGIINGTEYFSILNDNSPPLIGLDDPALYRINAELFFRLENEHFSERSYAHDVLKIIYEKTKQAAFKKIPPDQNKLFQEYLSWIEENSTIIEFAQYLYALTADTFVAEQSPQLSRLIESFRLQHSLDVSQLERQKYAILQDLHNHVLPDEYESILNAYMLLSVDNTMFTSFYYQLEMLCMQYGIDLERYPDVQKMIFIAKTFNTLNELSLKNELYLLVKQHVETSATSLEAPDFFSLFRLLRTLDDMIQLRASRVQYDFFTRQSLLLPFENLLEHITDLCGETFAIDIPYNDVTSIDYVISLAARFYQEATKRDTQLVANLLDAQSRIGGKTVILVTGGFHSSGITQLLKEHKISYAVLRPNLNAANLESVYRNIMFNESPELDAQLSMLQHMLMPSSNFRNLIYPDQNTIVLAKWLIISQALQLHRQDSITSTHESPLALNITATQDAWIEALRERLTDRTRALVAAGMISTDYVYLATQRFRELLNSVQLDYSGYRIYTKTQAIPLIIRQGDIEHRMIVSIRPDNAVEPDMERFIDYLDEYSSDGFVLRIWNETDLAHIHQLWRTMGTMPYELDEYEQQNLMILLDLFGQGTVDTLLKNYTPDDLPALLEFIPDYQSLKTLINTIGYQTAAELLLRDPNGLFNLAYSIGQIEDHEIEATYLNAVLSQSSRHHATSRPKPVFIMQDAEMSDVDTWFSYGIPRTFARALWDATENNPLFIKAVTPDGEIIGLLSARNSTDHNALFIDLLETTSNMRGSGIGTELIRFIAEESNRSGFNGAVVAKPIRGIEKFYTNLGFEPIEPGSKLYQLSPDKAAELIGTTRSSSTDRLAELIDEKRAAFFDLPMVSAAERIVSIQNKYGHLSDDDKLFILHYLMEIHRLTVQQALQELHNLLSDPGMFARRLATLYDALTDSWIAEYDVDAADVEAAVIRPELGMIPDSSPQLPASPIASAEYNDYQQLLDRIISLNQSIEASTSLFDIPLKDHPAALNTIRRMLRENALALDIEMLPATDPRITGKTAHMIENILYINENATRAELWFYLAHEVSHVINNEVSARIIDAHNITYLRSYALTIRHLIATKPDNPRTAMLTDIANRLERTAALHELDIATARIQITPVGNCYLSDHNLPRFKNVPDSYLYALAQSAHDIESPLILTEELTKLDGLLNDTQITDNQFIHRTNTMLTRSLFGYSLSAVSRYTGRINNLIDSWVSTQFNRRFWQLDTSAIPSSIKPFIDRSHNELGYIDITDIQRRITTHVRTIDNVAQRSAFSRDITQWVASLITDNVKNNRFADTLQDALLQESANCFAKTKLFALLGAKFGLTIEYAFREYTIAGIPILHAVNLLKLPDGTTQPFDIVNLSSNVRPYRTFMVVEENNTQRPVLLTNAELQQSDAASYHGLPQIVIDSFTLSNSAVNAYNNGDFNRAFALISQAYVLTPNIPYIASNMADIAFAHWLENARALEIQTEIDTRLQQIRSLYETYQAELYGSELLHCYSEAQRKAEEAIYRSEYPVPIRVEAIDPIGGGSSSWKIHLQTIAKTEKPSASQPVDISIKPNAEQPPAPPVPDPEPSTPTYGATTLEALQRLQLNQPDQPSQVRGLHARDEYMMNRLAGQGVDLSTARRLLQTGKHIEQLIQQQQLQEAETIIRGLDPRFSERILLEFPWIAAFMIELYPEWWRGTDLRQIARDMHIADRMRAMIREQMTTVQAVSATSDRDTTRRPYLNYPLWNMVTDRQQLRDALNRVYERNGITVAQYRIMTDLLQSDTIPNRSSLDADQLQALLGKADEIPVEGGIQFDNNYVIAQPFSKAPEIQQFVAYIEFIVTLAEEHPHELLYALRKLKGEPQLARVASTDKGYALYDALRASRGALSVVAQDIFDSISTQQVIDSVRQVNDAVTARYLLEAVMTSNLIRSSIRSFISDISQTDMLTRTERETIAVFNSYYLSGDEKTQNFRDGLNILANLSVEHQHVRDRIAAMLGDMKQFESGKILFALMQAVDATDMQDPQDIESDRIRLLNIHTQEFFDRAM